jgi:hypothetical protein
MNSFDVVNTETSFVAIGHFNPAIFQPEWFIRHDLVPEDDLKGPNFELQVVHPEVAQFATWFAIEVTTTRLVIQTSDMSRSEDLKDLVANIFSILPETPVTAAGFNNGFIVSCNSSDSWHKMGNILVPKNLWADALPEASTEPGGIGMKNLEVELTRWDDLPGNIRIIVYPSDHQALRPEVTFKVNDHIVINSYMKQNPSNSLKQLVLDHWEKSVSEAKNICTSVIGKIDDEN